MNDQEPAAIINNKIFTKLTSFRVKEIIRDIKEGKKVEEMYSASFGDGANRDDAVKSVVSNIYVRSGRSSTPTTKLVKPLRKFYAEAEMLFRNQAFKQPWPWRSGFPTGLKRDFCRTAPGERRYILCKCR
jgi:hypothetical protein